MPDIAEESGAVSARHVNVTDDQVGEVLAGNGKTCDTGIGIEDVIATLAEHQAVRLNQQIIIVDDENGFHVTGRSWHGGSRYPFTLCSKSRARS